MTRREDLLQQLEQIEDADDAEELIKEAWGEARKEALDYEHVMFAVKDMDGFEVEDIEDMLEDDSTEVNHK